LDLAHAFLSDTYDLADLLQSESLGRDRGSAPARGEIGCRRDIKPEAMDDHLDLDVGQLRLVRDHDVLHLVRTLALVGGSDNLEVVGLLEGRIKLGAEALLLRRDLDSMPAK